MKNLSYLQPAVRAPRLAPAAPRPFPPQEDLIPAPIPLQQPQPHQLTNDRGFFKDLKKGSMVSGDCGMGTWDLKIVG